MLKKKSFKYAEDLCATSSKEEDLVQEQGKHWFIKDGFLHHIISHNDKDVCAYCSKTMEFLYIKEHLKRRCEENSTCYLMIMKRRKRRTMLDKKIFLIGTRLHHLWGPTRRCWFGHIQRLHSQKMMCLTWSEGSASFVCALRVLQALGGSFVPSGPK